MTVGKLMELLGQGGSSKGKIHYGTALGVPRSRIFAMNWSRKDTTTRAKTR